MWKRFYISTECFFFETKLYYFACIFSQCFCWFIYWQHLLIVQWISDCYKCICSYFFAVYVMIVIVMSQWLCVVCEFKTNFSTIIILIIIFFKTCLFMNFLWNGLNKLWIILRARLIGVLGLYPVAVHVWLEVLCP